MRFSVSLDAAFLKKSYARRMFAGWWKLVIAAVVIVLCTFATAEGGRLEPWAIFGLSAVILMILLFSAAWFRQSKSLDHWLRLQGAGPVTYSLTEDEIETTSNVGSTKVKLNALSGIVITDFDTLLTFQSPAGALTLPTPQIPGDAIMLLKQRLGALGKKVEDRRKRPNETTTPPASDHP